MHAQSPVDGTVWEGLGDVVVGIIMTFMEVICHSRVQSKDSTSLPVCLLPGDKDVKLSVLLQHHACLLSTMIIMG